MDIKPTTNVPMMPSTTALNQPLKIQKETIQKLPTGGGAKPEAQVISDYHCTKANLAISDYGCKIDEKA